MIDRFSTRTSLIIRPVTGLLRPALLLLVMAACSSCEVPREPVLPADISGRWQGSYTLYDETGSAVTDSLRLELDSDGEEVTGEGIKNRMLADVPATETSVRVEGLVVVNTFRLELIALDPRGQAIFSGKVEGDTLAGRLSLDEVVIAELMLVGRRE